jgi:hypothetical protein
MAQQRLLSMDKRIREYLERATYCRQLAEGERDPEMRAYLLRLAADWTSAAQEEFSRANVD